MMEPHNCRICLASMVCVRWRLLRLCCITLDCHALVVLVVAYWVFHEQHPWLYRGGFALTDR